MTSAQACLSGRSRAGRATHAADPLASSNGWAGASGGGVHVVAEELRGEVVLGRRARVTDRAPG
jgi:hypothetical protein